MISDMFSLVGFVCQDLLLQHSCSERVTLDPGLTYQAHKAQRPFSAQSASAHSRMVSYHCQPTTLTQTGLMRIQEVNRDSTLCLTAEELKNKRGAREMRESFPTPETWELYSGYLEYKTSMNSMLSNRRFHGRRTANKICMVIVDMKVFQSEHSVYVAVKEEQGKCYRINRTVGNCVAQLNFYSVAWSGFSRPFFCSALYLSEGFRRRKKEEEKKALSPLVVQTDSSTCSTSSSRAETSGQSTPQASAPVGSPLLVLLPPLVHPTTPLSFSQQEKYEASQSTGPKNLQRKSGPLFIPLHVLITLFERDSFIKIQTQMAFSSYLNRVQMRLLAESRTNANSAWPEKDNGQTELVIRFLKRAACNLQQYMRMVLPSHQLPLQDCRRILSHQLAEFIHCYNKETYGQETEEDEENCINHSVFQEFITEASESDLEEVLTFYTTLINRLSCIWEFGHFDFEKPHCGKKTYKVKYRSTSNNNHSLVENKYQPTADQPTYSCSFPAALDCGHIHLQHYPHPQNPPLPLHCPHCCPQSHLHSPHQPQAPPHPQAFVLHPGPPVPSGHMGSSYPFPTTVSAPLVSQVLRQVQFFTSTSTAAALSSIPGSIHVYSQKLSRPTSADQGKENTLDRCLMCSQLPIQLDLDSLSAQTQSNQQAIVLALQKLAEKQAAYQIHQSTNTI
ncbi:unnamed protein product [Oncorhynchus mykiss]|uniref:Uncharacterized protein n=1 Tax=Oncorhynchus mykiss TaxID=8022 RepID=A0A060YK91_ONCMY|nr:unnamed protein product [Oncorhynchus mykiss]